MKTNSFLCNVRILLWIAAFPNMLCSPMNSGHSYQLTYSELQDLNVSCFPQDSCNERDQNVRRRRPYTCHCDSSCAQFGQCCIDSESMTNRTFEGSRNTMKCLPAFGKYFGIEQGVFMIDHCKGSDVGADHLCRSASEDTNDPFLMIPVTSTASRITYKNYFCLVCNEDLDAEDVIFWHLIVFDRKELNDTLPEFRYDSAMGYWTVVENNISRRVAIDFEIPAAVRSTVRFCKAHLRSECAGNWTDDSTRYKCKAYLDEVIVGRVRTIWYRNPHCALCNYEDLGTLSCPDGRSALTRPPLGGVAMVNLFLLDDKERRCGRRMVYDRFAKKCRCNVQKHVMKDGKCIERL